MTKFAPVAPIQVLEGLYRVSPELFGNYHLLLAHHTKEHLQRFYDLFRKIYLDDIIRPTVIMDNSVVELGGAVDFNMIMAATECIIDANENATVMPVLPDVMGDGEATRIAMGAVYPEWSLKMPGNGFMAVCQGKDLDDFKKTVNYVYESLPEVEWLGIPRYLVGLVGSRIGAIEWLQETGIIDEFNIHLLGFSDDMCDDHGCAHLEGIDGIDSAVPLRISVPFTREYLHAIPEKRPEDWFEKASVTPLMEANLRAARVIFEPQN